LRRIISSDRCSAEAREPLIRLVSSRVDLI
jgi:hypothetical protein